MCACTLTEIEVKSRVWRRAIPMFGEHLGGERHIVVDWSPIIEDLYSPELGFMDICIASVFSFLFDLPRVFECTHTVHCAL